MKNTEQRWGSGLAGWSIKHPIGVVMITLAFLLLGIFALKMLNIDLLPRIIYPDIRVRIINPNVPANIMEDEITRQLEEQLAITEDVIHIESQTREGRSAISLSFAYGKDVDIALRDASTRLDRAKRFLPDGIDPPVIYKLDPSQRPVAQYIVSSSLLTPIELRSWVDYVLSKQLINIAGVAAAEVGGGQIREIHIRVDQQRLASLGLDILDVSNAIQQANKETAIGRLYMPTNELSGRTQGRVKSLDELENLPLMLTNNKGETTHIRLKEIAQVLDSAEDQTLRIRFDGISGVKLSIQKQPTANTVAVMALLEKKIQALKLNPKLGISIDLVDNQATYIKQSLQNALNAAMSGGLLAMLVVFLFLGNLRHTLIIGSAIPIGILFTFILMALSDLTLNIMTLGGLALGIGLLVDNTIVMLENIRRHQTTHTEKNTIQLAAAEITSAIVASTSTNLAAILPFLFISGLVGLLFKELIITISAAIFASMIVALTLVPALAGHSKQHQQSWFQQRINHIILALQNAYGWCLGYLLSLKWLVIGIFVSGMIFTLPPFFEQNQIFLPKLDEARINIRLSADRGTPVAHMDKVALDIEALLENDPAVENIYTTVGGFVFGRSQYEASHRASIQAQLTPQTARQGQTTKQWIASFKKHIKTLKLIGVSVRIYASGLRGIRIRSGEDDLSIRISGQNIQTLNQLAQQLVKQLDALDILNNLNHSAEETKQELNIQIDRARAAQYQLTMQEIGKAIQYAVNGAIVTDFISQDRSINIRMRVNRQQMQSPTDLKNIILFTNSTPRVAIRLSDIAQLSIQTLPAEILRDKQQRYVEINASLKGDTNLIQVMQKIQPLLDNFDLPQGYSLYETGNLEALKEGSQLGQQLIFLALFLVFVVMAVQYESLRNPLIILICLPFAILGVPIGLEYAELPLSMPVWLGLIMLIGIVVNNAIVLVETIELIRQHETDLNKAIISAAKLRLRPILMTTLTTVVGMMPLALALGEGSKMLQPLAVTIISGLSFSMLVSLLLVPAIYQLFNLKSSTKNH